PMAATMQLESFFQGAEKIVIETLDADTVDFDRFDARVVELRGELENAQCEGVRLEPTADATLDAAGESRWQIPMMSSEDVGLVLRELAANRLAALYRPIVLWWTDGSAV